MLPAMESHTVSVLDTPVRWEEAGEGFPVVFIHGLPTSPALWRDVVPHVRGARCLAVEMVGYGESIPAGEGRDISVSRQADYLFGWLDEIGVDRAVFAGHDLGGGVAHIAAIRRPERCAGLLLTDAVGYDSWPIPAVKAMRRAAAVVERTPAPVLRTIFVSLLAFGHDDLATARASARLHWRAYERHGAGAAFVRQARSLDVRDTLAVQDRIADIRVPARVVWGAADPFLKVRYGERFAADLGVPLQRIEGGKHFTPEDHPGALAAAVNELVAEVSSAT